MSLLLWLFSTVLPLVQAGACPGDLASLLFCNFITRFQSSRLLLFCVGSAGLLSCKHQEDIGTIPGNRHMAAKSIRAH